MGNSSSKSAGEKQTLKEGTVYSTVSIQDLYVEVAIESVQRQMNYRPSEADSLQHDLDCLTEAKSKNFKVVVLDKKKPCSGGSGKCERHQYRN